jgi:hypothetical protein
MTLSLDALRDAFENRRKAGELGLAVAVVSRLPTPAPRIHFSENPGRDETGAATKCRLAQRMAARL